jgi:ribosomal-protein-alanine N-acetyltransferase
MKQPDKEYLTDIPTIDLGEIVLRAIVLEDYKDMYEYGQDDEVTKLLTWNSYQKLEDAKNSVIKFFLPRPDNGQPAAHAIVHKDTNKVIGTCDFVGVNWEKEEGEIGYVLHRDYWGKGYMTKVCKAVIDFGFDYLHLTRIVIRHHPDNIGSKRVIEKCGFTYTGQYFFKPYGIDIPSYEMKKTKRR